MNNTVKVKGGEVQIDSTLLFQRIICTIHSTEDLKTCFTYELASMPLSIFDEKGLMRKTKKSSLYQIFNTIAEQPIDFVDSDFVIDGGHLIHHVVWPKQGTFATVYTAYVEYVKKHYGQRVTVVFDGYSQNSNSTKSIERQQRLMQRISPEIIFDENTAPTEPQQKFLSNLVNKERFISQLITQLESEGIGVTVAADDADLLIVQTAVEKSYQCESAVIVGQDVDLVTLLIALSPSDKDIKFVKEERGETSKRIYSSRDLQSSTLLKNCKEAILFAHAISGCDTTSAFFCKGKIQTIALLNKRQDLQDVVPIFNNQESSHEDIASAGERYILALYKAPPGEESLDNYRFLAFNKLVGKAHNNVLLPKVPPTSAAARQHCYRVFHQIQAWKDNSLNPTEWGWKKLGNSLTPIPTTNALAPATILTLISCGCKLGCGNRCGCVKAGLRCSTMCTNCHGQACLNVDSIGSTEDDDDDDVDADDIP